MKYFLRLTASIHACCIACLWLFIQWLWYNTTRWPSLCSWCYGWTAYLSTMSERTSG